MLRLSGREQKAVPLVGRKRSFRLDSRARRTAYVQRAFEACCPSQDHFFLAGAGAVQLSPHYGACAPSPTSTKGAQVDGWALSGDVVSSINDLIERRIASARPIVGSFCNSAKAPVVSLTAALVFTAQWETRRARAPAKKKARARPESASVLPLSPAAVLQAESTTQSALSLSWAISEALRYPSSFSRSAVSLSLGGVRMSPGSASPRHWPASTPWVANCTTR